MVTPSSEFQQSAVITTYCGKKIKEKKRKTNFSTLPLHGVSLSQASDNNFWNIWRQLLAAKQQQQHFHPINSTRENFQTLSDILISSLLCMCGRWGVLTANKILKTYDCVQLYWKLMTYTPYRIRKHFISLYSETEPTNMNFRIFSELVS